MPIAQPSLIIHMFCQFSASKGFLSYTPSACLLLAGSLWIYSTKLALVGLRAAVSQFAKLEGLLIEYEDQFPYRDELIVERPPGECVHQLG